MAGPSDALFTEALTNVPPASVSTAVANPSTRQVLLEATRLAGRGRLGLDSPHTDAAFPQIFTMPPESVGRKSPGGFAEQPEPEGLEGTTGFIASALSAAGPEVFGFGAPESVERFRAENPTAGLVSDIGGSIAGFGALSLVPGAILARTVPPFARALGAASAIEGTFLRGATREAIRFAPFEALRVGGAAVSEDNTAEEQFKQSLIELGIASTLGGVITKVAGARPLPADRTGKLEGNEQLLARRFPADEAGGGFNPQANPQEKLSKLITVRSSEDALQNLDESERLILGSTIQDLKSEVRAQVPAQGDSAVKRLAQGNTRQVRELFKLRRGKEVDFATFTFEDGVGRRGSNGIQNRNLLEEAQGRLASFLPDDFEANTQFMRVIQARSKKGSQRVRKILADNLEHIGDDAFLGREVDGAYVVGKRLKGRTVPGKGFRSTGAKDDLFVVFKTDAPEIFFPNQARFAAAVQKSAFSLAPGPRLTGRLRGHPVARAIEETRRALPKGADLVEPPAGPVRRRLQRAPSGSARRDLLVATETGTKLVKRPLAASFAKFTDSRRADRVAEIIRRSFNKAHSRSVALMAGQRLTPRQRNLMLEVLEPARRASDQPTGIQNLFARLGIRVPVNLRGGMQVHIDDLTDAGRRDFSIMHEAEMSVEEAIEAGFDRTAVNLARRLRELDNAQNAELGVVADVTGDNLVFKENHHLITRRFRGNQRLEIRVRKPDGSAGAVVGFGTGNTRNEAVREAEALAKALRQADGTELVFDPRSVFRVSDDVDSDLRLANKIATESGAARRVRQIRRESVEAAINRTPVRFRERTGVQGFIGQTKPFTKQEISEVVSRNIRENQLYMTGRLLRDTLLKEDIDRVVQESPILGRQIEELISKSMGRPGRVTEAVNTAVDSLLAPVIGGNSASQITRRINQAMFTLTLGALDAGFPVLNAMTFVQTTLPESSFVLTAPLRDMQKYYAFAPAAMPGGGVRHVGWFEPGRLLFQGMRDIKNSDDGLKTVFTQLTKQGVIAPRFTEEFLGQSRRLQPIKEAVAERGQFGAFVNYLDEVNKFMPSVSEEMVRLHAAAVGRRLFRDVYGLEDGSEQLIANVGKFVERTMFTYSTVDRPQLLTGPVGSFAGLFKTWALSYLGLFGSYARQGFTRGNFKPLLWAMAGTSSLGGVTAAPGFFAADQFSRVVSDAGLMENVFDMWGGDEGMGDRVADSMLYGLPAGLFGLSLSARAGVPGSDPIRDVNQLFSVATFDRMAAVKQFGGAAFDRFLMTGEGPGSSRRVTDLFFKAFAPRTVQRFVQSTHDNAVRSLSSGNQLSDSLSGIDRAAFTLGVTPTEVRRGFDINSELYSQTNEMREVVTQLGEEYAEAMEQNDFREMSNIIRRVYANGVPPDRVIRSGVSNFRNRNTPVVEAQHEKLLRQREGLAKGLGIRNQFPFRSEP